MFDTIVGAVDWSDVSGAVVAVGALIAAVYVVLRGVGMILAVIEGKQIERADAEYYRDYYERD